MSTLLIRSADVVVTMDAQRREIRGGSVFIRGNAIETVGSDADVAAWIVSDAVARTPASTISARGCVVMPGMVNCHHHLFQSLTRTVGTGGGLGLFDWLKLLYPIWSKVDPDAIHVSAKLALCELVLSGATTVADHLYLFPNGSRLDDEIRAAQELGVRFHPTRGSMSVGESAGGLPPDYLVEDEKDILADSRRVLETFHDPAPISMLRVGLAPCSPFSVTSELMIDTARLARSHERVGLHTHLAETLDENRYCLEKFGKRPLEFVEELDWHGDEVWFAHMVHPDEDEIGRMAASRSGVCHCPSSNMILASGIAPVRAMLDAGVKVAIGVDGSASNDGNHMLGEARQAMLLQRVGWPGFEARADRMTAREALELATLGGAKVLQRNDIGSLEPGNAADLVAFRVDGIEHAGGQSDPVASLLTCAPGRAWLSVINGCVVVEDGMLRDIDLGPLIERHNRIARGLLEKAGLGLIVTRENDLAFLRKAIFLSEQSRARGNHPFAAVVTDVKGTVLAEAMNDIHADCTSHAELVAVRLASSKFNAVQLRDATLYSSAEPCAMCAGAIYWSGIGRVVYALSEERLLPLTGNHPENPTLSLPCREVFSRGQRAIEVVGPLLENEAAIPHKDFWR